MFLPFWGCPARCAFCAQDRETGSAGPLSRAEALPELEHSLARDLEHGRADLELAFFGGTFTGLPLDWIARFLALAERFRKEGLLSRVRCSTRPDMVESPLLRQLRAMGLDMIELGVQSFDDGALTASRRGYAGHVAREACAAVPDAGLALGVQLMPGMPGCGPDEFEADIEAAANFSPQLVRLYPCLVIEGTALARVWRAGEFHPWSLDAAAWRLAEAVLRLWLAGARLGRVGLAPEPALAKSILAGPWEPSLGSRVRGRALFLFLQEQILDLGRSCQSLDAPRRFSGEFWGHSGELAPAYAKIGLDRRNVRFHDDRDDFELN